MHTRLGEYNFDFEGVLGDVKIEELVRERGGEARVMDFMGYGQVLPDLGTKHGLAVALSDQRTEKMKRDDVGAIDLIGGDILLGATWDKIKLWMKKCCKPGEKFDVILARPMAGLSDIPKSAELYYALLQNLYELLSVKDGVLITQVSQSFTDELERLADKINNIEGVEARCYIPRTIQIGNIPIPEIYRGPLKAPRQLF